MPKHTNLHCHRRGLESSSGGVKPTKSNSNAIPMQLEGSRCPKSDPKIYDVVHPPPARPTNLHPTPFLLNVRMHAPKLKHNIVVIRKALFAPHGRS
jgi:hypothetical protein